MEKMIQGDFVEIIKKALAEMPEGKIEFLGPTEGFVSVIFIEGDILLIDSTWGAGNDELQRIYDWGSGTCVFKDITPEERNVLETKWQRHVILEQDNKETKGTIVSDQPLAVQVQTVLRNFKRESLDLDAFCVEIKNNKYSGEASVTTPEGKTRILFYQGQPLVSSNRRDITIRDVVAIMDVPRATINFYILGDELAHAFLSVLQGEKVWAGFSVTVFHLDKMLDKLMEKNPTGHLCIHKEKGDRHYVFFSKGKSLGAYNIDDHWMPGDIDAIWEGAHQVDYYLSGTIESFLTAAAPMDSPDDFQKFMAAWNGLLEIIAKKLGKKPVEKSLQKSFKGLSFYAIDGIMLRVMNAASRDVHDAVAAFKQKVPGFLREMEVIVGSHWLNEQLQGFQEKNNDLVNQFALREVFTQKGG